MASKGPTISTNNDGHDHAFRQRVAAHYQTSALNKSRLKYCVFFHYFLSFAMLAKLAPYVLDQFNFFILAIEELEIPEPFAWEWVWATSILASVFCLDAIKKNSVTSMRNYMIGIVLLGYGPLLWGAAFWFPDVWVYLFADEDDEAQWNVLFWNDYPAGMLWFIFIILALQVHGFSMYFSYKLMSAWKSRGTRKAD